MNLTPRITRTLDEYGRLSVRLGIVKVALHLQAAGIDVIRELEHIDKLTPTTNEELRQQPSVKMAGAMMDWQDEERKMYAEIEAVRELVLRLIARKE